MRVQLTFLPRQTSSLNTIKGALNGRPIADQATSSRPSHELCWHQAVHHRMASYDGNVDCVMVLGLDPDKSRPFAMYANETTPRNGRPTYINWPSPPSPPGPPREVVSISPCIDCCLEIIAWETPFHKSCRFSRDPWALGSQELLLPAIGDSMIPRGRQRAPHVVFVFAFINMNWIKSHTAGLNRFIENPSWGSECI